MKIRLQSLYSKSVISGISVLKSLPSHAITQDKVLMTKLPRGRGMDQFTGLENLQIIKSHLDLRRQ